MGPRFGAILEKKGLKSVLVQVLQTFFGLFSTEPLTVVHMCHDSLPRYPSDIVAGIAFFRIPFRPKFPYRVKTACIVNGVQLQGYLSGAGIAGVTGNVFEGSSIHEIKTHNRIIQVGVSEGSAIVGIVGIADDDGFFHESLFAVVQFEFQFQEMTGLQIAIHIQFKLYTTGGDISDGHFPSVQFLSINDIPVYTLQTDTFSILFSLLQYRCPCVSTGTF
jgi:hypothetical protein